MSTNKQALLLNERIEKALSDFTSGRASMHVPPLDTDVDMVLADCSTALEYASKRYAEQAAIIAKQEKWIKDVEVTMIAATDRAEAAEKRIATLGGIILSSRNFINDLALNGDAGAAEFIAIIDRTAGITVKGADDGN